MNQFPCLIRKSTAAGEVCFALGDALVDSYLAFVAGRCRPNTLRAVAHDLKTFFTVIDKAPVGPRGTVAERRFMHGTS
jgi:integrase/recombinase XerD